MDTCICTAESLCCSPETITTLLIDYTPIQNLSKVREIVKDREAWHTVVHGVTKNQT